MRISTANKAKLVWVGLALPVLVVACTTKFFWAAIFVWAMWAFLGACLADKYPDTEECE